MIRDRSSRTPDAVLRGRLRYLANKRRRFGYRRQFVLLRREGEPSGIDRIYRFRWVAFAASTILDSQVGAYSMQRLGTLLILVVRDRFAALYSASIYPLRSFDNGMGAVNVRWPCAACRHGCQP